MQKPSPVSQDNFHGYTVAYEQEELQFPVYVVAFIGACLAAGGYETDNVFLIALALCCFGYAYHNFPLLETGRLRFGAGQYGVFAEGLGVIAWRAIKDIEMREFGIRGAASSQLLITLREPLDKALIADWRKRPFYRFLMRLPWAPAGDDTIRVPLDIFDKPAADIFESFTRMMKFYRH